MFSLIFRQKCWVLMAVNTFFTIASLNCYIFPRLCFYFMFVCLLSLMKGSSQLILAAGSSITLRLACQLVHRNPQSDFDSGVVLLMHACFYHPGGREKIWGLWTDTIVAGCWQTGTFWVMQLEEDTMMKHSRRNVDECRGGHGLCIHDGWCNLDELSKGWAIRG